MASAPIRIPIETSRRTQWVDITAQVAEAAHEAGLRDGSVLVFVPHTTAGVTINENADPSVAADMMKFLDGCVPRRCDFAHAEGNADAHIKASLMGSSVRVIVREGRLCLGTWQGVFFCEFDGPRRREAWFSIDAAAVPTQDSREASR